jgi:hypothetical protein
LVKLRWLEQGGGLRAVQEIGSALRMRRRGEDRAVITLQHLERMIDTASVIGARLGRQFEVGAEERRAELIDSGFRCG